MNKEIANILKDRLVNSDLPFISKYFGMVDLVLEPVEGELNTTMTKRLPVATEFTYILEDGSVACVNKEQLAIPDSSQKGIIYFEDNGTTITSSGKLVNYISKLDLVCWINVARIKEDFYERIDTSAITMVIDSIKGNNRFENIDIFQKFNVNPKYIKSKNSNIFSKYTYDEAHTQYLRPPFTYFSISIEVSYSVNSKCLTNFETIEGEICY